MNGINWNLGDKKMLISHFETRPDWKLIVQSVPCPVCAAEQEQPCRNLGAIPGTLYADSPRHDWHQERKAQAVSAFMAFQEKPAEVTEKVEEPEEVKQVSE
jgi:hypothetical protein